MSGKKTQMGSFFCEGCSTSFERARYDIKHSLKIGQAGARFCGHGCSQIHRSVLGHKKGSYNCATCKTASQLSIDTVAAQKTKYRILGIFLSRALLL